MYPLLRRAAVPSNVFPKWKSFESTLSILHANDALDVTVGSSSKSGRRLGPSDWIQFAFALEHNTSLSSMTLWNADPGLFIACAEALKHNVTLKCLWWRGALVDEQALVLMADTLKQNSTILEFRMDLVDGQFGNASGVAMADMLRNNSTLEVFRMGIVDGGFGDEVCAAMAEALRHNSTLRSFMMCYSNMAGDTLAAMLEAIATSPSLQSCEFYSDSMSDQVGVPLAAMLKQSSTLTSFALGGGSLSDETGLAMADALKYSSRLQKLRLLDDNFGGPYAAMGRMTEMAIVDALQYNATLQELGMGYSWSTRPQIDEALERNLNVPVQWRTLVQLARGTYNTGFRSLKELNFRREIMKFFLPPFCLLTPSADGMMTTMFVASTGVI